MLTRKLEKGLKVIEEVKGTPQPIAQRFLNCDIYEMDFPSKYKKLEFWVKSKGTKLTDFISLDYPSLTSATLETTQKNIKQEINKVTIDFMNITLKNLDFSGTTVVYGTSVSGKSTVLHDLQLYLNEKQQNREILWDNNKSILSHFGSDGYKWLISTGLNSVKSWCKCYRILSTGEKYRAYLARLLLLHQEDKLEHYFVIDNFCTYLDRQTSMSCAISLSKFLRKENIPAILVVNDFELVAAIQPKLIFKIVNRELKIVQQSNLKKPGYDIKYSVPLSYSKLPLEGSGEISPRISAESSPQNLRQAKAICCTFVQHDKHTKRCETLFDHEFTGENLLQLNNSNFETLLNKNQHFRIGIITGKSGSLKSALAKHYFSEDTKVYFPKEEPVLSCFSKSKKTVEVFNIFSSCIAVLELITILSETSFNDLSPCLKEVTKLSYLLCSNNELKERVICVDEFLSCFDMATCIELQKSIFEYIRENTAHKWIFVMCKEFILRSLADWVFQTDAHLRILNTRTTRGASCSSHFTSSESAYPGKPILHLKLLACSSKDYFKEYHYKTEKLSKKCYPFVLVKEEKQVFQLVGFVAAISQIGKFSGFKAFRAHRTVILPNWQGIGLGSLLSDLSGEIFTQSSLTERDIFVNVATSYENVFDEHNIPGVYFGQTVHPLFGGYRERSSRWKPAKHNNTVQEYKIETWKQRKKGIRVKLNTPKFIYSHIYIGKTPFSMA
eukprot:maker-scaffold_58-snap-gene-0.24-mRNA-1 protein AED:0.11 eAED:0.20 QI:0/0/0/1/1/1/3/0/725